MSVPVPGEVLAGKYRVERVLGSGGMGVVLLATHIQLEQRVAIKLLLPDALQNAEAIRRFVQEAKAAARIRGDHVVRVHDVGTLDNGNPYLVMEYLEGEDLDSVVRSRGRLHVEEAVDYVLQACEAIAEAHGVGIIHRDLKPANLFLAAMPDGARSIKVLDFGISKISPKAGAAAQSVTKTRALMGSPLYMSPEQMLSTKSTTPKADVWALGVILYELLVGAPPFTGETMPEICARVLAEPVPPLASGCPDAPPELAAVIELATQKEASARCDVAGLAQALAPFASAAGRISADRVVRVARAVSSTLLSEGVSASGPTSLPSGGTPRPVAGGNAGSGGFAPAPAASGASLAISVSVSTPWQSISPLGASPAPVPTAETTSAVPLSSLPARPATLATFGTTAPPQASRARSLLLVGGGIVGASVVGLALYMGLRTASHPTLGSSGAASGAVTPSAQALPVPSATVAIESKPASGPSADPATTSAARVDAGTITPVLLGDTPKPAAGVAVQKPGNTIRTVPHPAGPAVPKPANPKKADDNPFDSRFSP